VLTSWGSRTAAFALVVTSTSLSTIVAPTPAAAVAVVTFVDGVATITGDFLDINCESGSLRIERGGPPSDVPCNQIEHLVVQGSDLDSYATMYEGVLIFPLLVETTIDTGNGNNAVEVFGDRPITVTGGDGPDWLDVRNQLDVDAALGGGDDRLQLSVDAQEPLRTWDVLADLGTQGPLGNEFSLGVQGFEPNEYVSYPVPGGGDVIAMYDADWRFEVHGARPIHVRGSNQFAEFEFVPTRTADVDFRQAASGPTTTIYADTRGLDIEFSNSQGFGHLALPGFRPMVFAPIQSDVFIYNGRYYSLIPALYQQFLGRDSDESGFDFWYDRLWDGLSHATMVDSMLRLPEHATLTVNNEYQHILGRPADAGGLTYWASFLGAGGSPDNLRSLLYGSAEYLGNAGGTTDGFLDALYQDVLGRAPDPDGRNYWSSFVNSGRLNRTDMARVVLSMDEPINVALTRLYNDLLDRDPAPAELTFWRPAWRQIGEFGVIASIAGGGEYYEHVAPLDPADPYYFTDDAQATAAADDDRVQAAAEPVDVTG
jgi:hypothetical protein